MGTDSILMIPHLSKELNLIGYPTLPYTLKKKRKTKLNSKCSDETLEITFNSRQMIETLSSVCFELVKQVKRMAEDENNDLDKLNFDNLRLEKHLKLNKSETKKLTNEVAVSKKINQQLQEKIDLLQKKLKHCDIEQQNFIKKSQTNENILRHALKKKESELFELHKAIWKQFNMANKNYLPENFELIQLNQPDFSKLWSTVKYSDTRTREGALKKAVCIFQNNYKALMEDNFMLKTSFLTVLQEMDEVCKLMVDKLHMPKSIISLKIKEIFGNIEELNVSQCTDILKKYFEIVRKICNLFDEASFIFSDDLFVCWSNITKRL